MPVRRQSPLFEGLHRKFVLGMMARARRQLDVTQFLQLAPYGGCIERHRELVVKPLDQVDQPPAHNPMNRRDRPALDCVNKGMTLRIIEPGPGAGSLAVKQAIRASFIEPNHPVPHDLQAHTTDPRRRSPAATIIIVGLCQKPPRLVRALRCARQSPQRHPVKIIPQADR